MLRVTSPEAWIELGATPGAIQEAVTRGPEGLEELQANCKKRYRELAREYHPDLGGGKKGERKLAALTVANEEIRRITCRPIPPPRPQIRIVFSGPFVSINSTSGFGGSISITGFKVR